MGTALRTVRGMARMALVPGTSGDVYDETYTNGSEQPINTIITLPNSGTYADKDLEVYLEGILLEDGIDFDYVGTGTRTQIELLRVLPANDKLRFRVDGDSASIYDETYVVGVGGLTAGATITLPSSGTYDSADLLVYLEGILLNVVQDYDYVGSSPRTQIQTVIDLEEGERLRFRIL